jgi:hypothetical protein
MACLGLFLLSHCYTSYMLNPTTLTLTITYPSLASTHNSFVYFSVQIYTQKGLFKVF